MRNVQRELLSHRLLPFSLADCIKKHGAGYAICSPAFVAFLLMNDLFILNGFERGNFCFQITVYVLFNALKVNKNLCGRQKLCRALAEKKGR